MRPEWPEMALGCSKSLHTSHVDLGDRQPHNQTSVSALAISVAWAQPLRDLEPQFFCLYNGAIVVPWARGLTQTPALRTIDRGCALGLWDPGWASRGVGQGGGDGKWQFPDHRLWMGVPL